MSTSTTSQTRTGFFAESRRRSAIALLVGALLMEVLIQQQHVRFYYTPLIVGLTYLAAAAAAGRRGALWAPGIITTCWGIAVLLGIHGVTHGSKTSYEIAGLIGIAIALALRYTVGLAAGYVGMVVAFVIILLHDHSNVPSWVFKGVTFAVLLGVWGLWELRPTARSRTSVRNDDTGSGTTATSRNEASARV